MRTYLTALVFLFVLLVQGCGVAIAGDCCSRGASAHSQTVTRLQVTSVATETVIERAAPASSCCSSEDALGGCCGNGADCDCDDDCGCSDVEIASAPAIAMSDDGPVTMLLLASTVVCDRTTYRRSICAPPQIDVCPGRRRTGLILEARLIPLRV